MSRRKCVLILLDGLGDRAYESLGHRTPLQAAKTPHLDALAKNSACGLFHATHLGQSLPSENAHFSIFGYTPDEFPGRGVLEALGHGMKLADDEVVILAHLASVRHVPGGIELVMGELKADAEQADALFAPVSAFEAEGLQFQLRRTHRLFGLLTIRGGASRYITDTDPLVPGRLLIEPQPWHAHANDPAAQRTARALKAFLQFAHDSLPSHPANAVRKVAAQHVVNALVTQRAGKLLPNTPRFRERYGLRGLMLASGIVLPGLAAYIGMDCRNVRDTDRPDKDLADRITLARTLLTDYDFIHVHTKIPDEAAHTKDPKNKVRSIEYCDAGIGAAIGPLLEDPNLLIVVTSDHSTPSSGEMIHAGEPVPLMMHGQWTRRDRVDRFDEIEVASGALSLVRGRELMYLILSALDVSKLDGLMDTTLDQPYWPGDFLPLSLNEPTASGPDEAKEK